MLIHVCSVPAPPAVSSKYWFIWTESFKWIFLNLYSPRIHLLDGVNEIRTEGFGATVGPLSWHLIQASILLCPVCWCQAGSTGVAPTGHPQNMLTLEKVQLLSLCPLMVWVYIQGFVSLRLPGRGRTGVNNPLVTRAIWGSTDPLEGVEYRQRWTTDHTGECTDGSRLLAF